MEDNATDEQLDFTSFSKPIPIEQFNDPAFLNRSPDDERPSFGHGTLEILEVTKSLEKAGITCCVVGISALIYYGAWRVRRVSLKQQSVAPTVALLTCTARTGRCACPQKSLKMLLRL